MRVVPLPSRTLIWLALSGCDACETDPHPDPIPTSVIEIDAAVAEPTVWSNDNVYVVRSEIQVLSALTIQPGTVVKFEQGAGLSIESPGTLTATGSGEQHVIFTSIKDDAHGGDTNGDGDTTAAAAHDWGLIDISDGASAALDRCEFSYGGGGYGYTATVAITTSSAVSITNSVFAHNDGGSLDSPDGALDARYADGSPILTGNVFYDNNLPLTIGGSFAVDETNQFRSGEASNRYNGIVVDADAFDGPVRWSNTEVAHVILRDMYLPAAASLTLAPGVVVKLAPGAALAADGTLLAPGSSDQGIIITSLKDDQHGGDTNGDAGATSPAPRDWGYITLTGSASVDLDHVELLYAGGGYGFAGTLDLGTSYGSSITNCVFSHNDGGTISGGDGVLVAKYAGADTTITGNAFYANNLPLTIGGRYDVDASNVFHDPANAGVKNEYNAIVFYSNVASDGIHGAISWSNTEVPYVFAFEDLDISSGNTLELADNVVLKFGYDTRVSISGDLVASSSNIFTSLKDDQPLGNTDGSPAPPGPDDWQGVYDYNEGEWQNAPFEVRYAEHTGS